MGSLTFMFHKLAEAAGEIPPASNDGQECQEDQRTHHDPGRLVGVVVVNAVIGGAAAVLAVEGHKDGAEHVESRQEDGNDSEPEQYRLAGKGADQNLVLAPESGQGPD